jgi:hypothetical protein
LVVDRLGEPGEPAHVVEGELSDDPDVERPYIDLAVLQRLRDKTFG